jgi:hypothetical protein
MTTWAAPPAGLDEEDLPAALEALSVASLVMETLRSYGAVHRIQGRAIAQAMQAGTLHVVVSMAGTGDWHG